MRFAGTIKKWDDDRGFGFIEPGQGGQEIFVHIKAFPVAMGRPVVGAKVSFELENTPEGKKRAVRVQPLVPAKKAAPASKQYEKPWDRTSLLALGGFGLLYLLVTIVWKLSTIVGLVYCLMSAITFVFYWVDKRAAMAGTWRISEQTLIGLGAFCGWPGAIVAQHLFQHKTTKPSFRFEHWGSVITNVSMFVLVTTPLLQKILRALLR